MRALFRLSSTLVIALSLGLISCGPSGPESPQPGTNAYLWWTAQESFKKGNFIDVSNQLDKLTGKESEYKLRAQAWQMIVATGVARGNAEWADIVEEGLKLNRDRQLEFHRIINGTRSEAHQMVMRAAQINLSSLDALAAADIALPVALPNFPVDLPVEAGRVKKGVSLKPAEQEVALLAMQRRAVLKALALFAGAGDDLKKAAPAFATGEFKLAKQNLLIGIATQFSELTDMYTSKKLAESARVKMLCEGADKALKGAQAGADTKAIQKKLEAARKKLPKD